MSNSQLQQIHIYPIKSSRGISLSNSWVDDFGLSFDRRFVITDLNGQFITARTESRICLIQANITANGLILTAPDMPILHIDYQHFSQKYQSVTVWKDTIDAQDCHQDYDLWFSQYLNKPCRLHYFGDKSKRQVKNSNSSVAFADGYPLLLISQASLEALSNKAGINFSMAQFRPNLVVSDCEPFEEDSWQHIRIGEVEFELTKPCSRCIFTTVDPLTAEKHSRQEPLQTLKQFRQVEGGDVMFGQNLIQLNQGQVKVGDSVTVLARQSPPAFVIPAKKGTDNNQKAAKAPQKFTLTCIDIINETHDVKTFAFTTKNKEKVDYIPGQHLPMTLLINGDTVNACYTLSSSSTRDNYLKITVKRVEQGLVSNFLHDSFQVGDEVIASTPSGNFHLEKVPVNKVLLLSAGSGVTPMLSMLKGMVDNKNRLQSDDIVFFHSAHSEDDIIARQQVAQLQEQHGNCQVLYTLTREIKPQWQGFQGRLNQNMLSKIKDLTSRQVFVCGPLGFRETAKKALLALGLPEQQFHFESFGDNRARSPKDITSAEKAQTKAVNLLFDSWDKSVLGNNQQTILEQAEDAGLHLPFACRSGMCGTCRIKLESGEVTQLANDALTEAEQAQNYVLACSCIPKTDIVISGD